MTFTLKKIIVLTLIVISSSSFVLASETDGTILNQASYKNARFVMPDGSGGVKLNPQAGFINFRPTLADFFVRITDLELTGYAWGDRVGYINFNSKNCDADLDGVTDKGNFSFCSVGNTVSNFKVSNTEDGILSGFAWGENAGWINFNAKLNCDKDSNTFSDVACGGDNTSTVNGNFGVIINRSGQFEGFAWSENFGYIQFNCAVSGACVRTDWRPIEGRDTGTTNGSVNQTNPTVTPVIPPTVPVVPPVVQPVVPPVVVPVIPVTPPVIPVVLPIDPIIVAIDPVSPPTDPVNPSDSGDSGLSDNNENSDPKTTGQAISSLFDAIFNPKGNNQLDKDGSSGVFKDALTNIFGQDNAEDIKQYFDEQKEIFSDAINTPAGDATSKVTTAAGIVSGVYISTMTSLFANPLALADLFLIPIRLWGLLMIALGIKKRNLPWGTVYDSITKQPLDPAYVVLSDLSGREVATSITDIDGRYGFLVPAGRYIMSANKTNYTFPSVKLAGKSGDELYQDLYFNEIIELKEGGVISKNIPLDPIKFDWNEFAKKDKNLMKFFSDRSVWISRISNFIFYLGFILTIVIVFVSPNGYNYLILGIYILMLILKNTILKPRSFGRIKYKEDGTPLSFAIMRIFSPGSDREVIHKVTDQTGKYFCLIPNGLYYAKIENKNADQTYSPAHISGPLEVKKGYINKEFDV